MEWPQSYKVTLLYWALFYFIGLGVSLTNIRKKLHKFRQWYLSNIVLCLCGIIIVHFQRDEEAPQNFKL